MNEVLHQVFEKFGSINAMGFFLLFVLSSFVLIPRPLLCISGGYLLDSAPSRSRSPAGRSVRLSPC